MDKFKKYFLSSIVFLINIGLVFLGYQAIKKNSETKKSGKGKFKHSIYLIE